MRVLCLGPSVRLMMYKGIFSDLSNYMSISTARKYQCLQGKLKVTSQIWITAAACNTCDSKKWLLSTVPESSLSSHHDFQQKMFLLLDIWHHKSQKKDPGLGRAVQEGGKLKMAEVDQEMMLLILFSSSPGGNHENWALVVSVIAGNVVIWGSCSPKLLGEDSRERMGDSDQPVAEMCSCLQISAWLKNGTFPCHASKQAI